jgi:high-affinity nickel-transport protein
MTLIDTTDSVLMTGAYGWAFVKPVRKLYYNMTITFVSVIVAVVIGGVEALSLIADKFALHGGLWDMVANINGTFGLLGYLIIGIFAASVAASMLVYRLKGYDALEARVAPATAPPTWPQPAR